MLESLSARECRYDAGRLHFQAFDKLLVIAVTFNLGYLHVTSAFPLAHHYLAVLAWGS
jgi:hypothetical protein